MPPVLVDPEEASAYGLPATMCRCDVERVAAGLRTEGFMLVETDVAVEVASLGARRLIRPAHYRFRSAQSVSANPGPRHFIVWGSFVPTWVVAVRDTFHDNPPAMVRGLIKSLAADPLRASAVAALWDIGGARAVADHFAAPMHARTIHDLEDTPDDALSRRERAARRRGQRPS